MICWKLLIFLMCFLLLHVSKCVKNYPAEKHHVQKVLIEIFKKWGRRKRN